MERLPSSVLPPSALTGSGGAGTTGGLPVHRDPVPVVLRELLSASSEPQPPSQCTETAGSLPFPLALLDG